MSDSGNNPIPPLPSATPPATQDPARPIPPREEASSKKITCGILGILLGGFGIHKFVLGYTVPGVVLLAGTLVGWAFTVVGSLLVVGLCCAIIPIGASVIGLVEGVIYLTKTDQQFYDTYMVGKREWF